MKTFTIKISDDHFEALLNDELIANSRSSNDLLGVLNQVAEAAGILNGVKFASLVDGV